MDEFKRFRVLNKYWEKFIENISIAVEELNAENPEIKVKLLNTSNPDYSRLIKEVKKQIKVLEKIRERLYTSEIEKMLRKCKALYCISEAELDDICSKRMVKIKGRPSSINLGRFVKLRVNDFKEALEVSKESKGLVEEMLSICSEQKKYIKKKDIDKVVYLIKKEINLWNRIQRLFSGYHLKIRKNSRIINMVSDTLKMIDMV